MRDDPRIPVQGSIRDAAVACAWLSAGLDLGEPVDTLLEVFDSLGFRAPRGLGWLDVLSQMRARREAGSSPGTCGPGLLLPRPGDARGVLDLPPAAYDVGAALLIDSQTGRRTWLIPATDAEWMWVASAPGAGGTPSAPSWAAQTPQDADRELRAAVLAAAADFDDAAASVPTNPDARDWDALVRGWERAPWPRRAPGSQVPDITLGIRAARLLAAVALARSRDRGVTVGEDACHRRQLDVVDRAARSAIEVAFSARPRGTGRPLNGP